MPWVFLVKKLYYRGKRISSGENLPFLSIKSYDTNSPVGRKHHEMELSSFTYWHALNYKASDNKILKSNLEKQEAKNNNNEIIIITIIIISETEGWREFILALQLISEVCLPGFFPLGSIYVCHTILLLDDRLLRLSFFTWIIVKLDYYWVKTSIIRQVDCTKIPDSDFAHICRHTPKLTGQILIF